VSFGVLLRKAQLEELHAGGARQILPAGVLFLRGNELSGLRVTVVLREDAARAGSRLEERGEPYPAGRPAGEESCIKLCTKGAQVPAGALGTQDVDVGCTTVFLIVAATIRRGDLQHPERLMGFVRTVLYAS